MGMISGIAFILLLFLRPQPKDKILIDFITGRKAKKEANDSAVSSQSPSSSSSTEEVKVDIKADPPTVSAQ
jgi:hypothetical protein